MGQGPTPEISSEATATLLTRLLPFESQFYNLRLGEIIFYKEGVKKRDASCSALVPEGTVERIKDLRFRKGLCSQAEQIRLRLSGKAAEQAPCNGHFPSENQRYTWVNCYTKDGVRHQGRGLPNTGFQGVPFFALKGAHSISKH